MLTIFPLCPRRRLHVSNCSVEDYVFTTPLSCFASYRRRLKDLHRNINKYTHLFLLFLNILIGGKVVVVTNGRYAGKKAVIIKCNDEGTNARPYGHALICGLRTVPRKITKKMDQKKQDKRSRCKTFIKYINLNHLMPTRYSIDVELKGVVSPDVLDDSTKKIAAQKESKKLFEERFKTGKNRWFFTRLAF